MKLKRLIPALLLGALALPVATQAQEMAWTVQEPSRGWIGFYYDYAKATVEGESKTVVVVTEVVEGSPASLAELEVGDILTHLDGQPVSLRVFESLSQSLGPGDLVRLTVSREGQPEEIVVEAVRTPPRVVVAPNADEMVIHLETLSGNIIRNLDSIRLSIEGVHVNTAPGEMSLQLLRVPSPTEEEGEFGFSFHIREAFLDSLVFGPDLLFTAPELAMPFPAMLVDSEATAALKEELARVRKELTGVRREEQSRQRALAAAGVGPIEEILQRDERIKQLRETEGQLQSEQRDLIYRLREVSENELQRQWMEMQSRSEEAFFQAQRAQVEALRAARRDQEEMDRGARTIYEYARDLEADTGERFRSPVIIGQTIILGAQLAPLNPDLAEVFSVDEGVFVVGVMEGTPASDAGLQGGDVIVMVGGEEVTSLSDFRFSLGAFEGPLQIRLVRKGSPVEIQIRR